MGVNLFTGGRTVSRVEGKMMGRGVVVEGEEDRDRVGRGSGV